MKTLNSRNGRRYLKALGMEALEGRMLLSTTYTPIDLGTVDGGNHTFDPAINAAGNVVGSGTDSNQHSRVFLYTGGALTDLGLPPGDQYFSASAAGINASGLVAANSFLTTNLTHATVGSGGGFTDLGTGGSSYNESFAAGLNNAGTVVGKLYNSVTGTVHAFASSGGGLTDLGVVSTAGFDVSVAAAINTAGVITGSVEDSVTTVSHAMVYANGTMTDIGVPTGFSNGFGRAINDSGEVAGDAYGNGTHGFIYANGAFQDLGNIGGNGEVTGINDSGTVVGMTAVSGADKAFVYQGGVITDLNTLLPANSGWVLGEATGINDAGQIVGNGSINGQQHAFLLNPSGTVVTPPVVGGTLPPTLSGNTLASSVVAGGKLKKAASFCVTVGNTSGAAVKAGVTVKILAVSGNTSEAIATVTKTLKIGVGGTSTPVKLTAKSLPADLASGTYTLTAESIDASGKVTTAATGPTVTVAAPFVSLSAVVSNVVPATIKVGKTGAFTVTLTNSGNVDAAASATITTGFALSSAGTPTLGTPQTKTVKVVVGKPTKLKLKLPALTVAGKFVPFVSITEAGVTATAFGATVFTVA